MGDILRLIRSPRSVARKYSAILFAAALFSQFSIAQEAPGHAAFGRPAPNFTRIDLTHKPVELSHYRGKVVLLNFWASWCGPCLTEMPIFAQWQNQYNGRGLQVIGVSMDDSVHDAASAVAKLRLDYPVVMGDEHIGIAYGGVLGLPVTFLIDRSGIIRGRYQGADLTRIKSDLEHLLGASK
jgi:cytochrome c biogenesis protein CcmG/thiol:disulfide interchange protein DsbE